MRIPILVAADPGDPVAGGTVFPADVGLGATRDPDLARRIGQARAEELAATGVDGLLGPCLCVARDDRWPGAPESFGEKPEIAASMSTMVTGLQGGPASVLATARGFVGSGGTTDGVDRGDTLASETDLRAIHLAPFRSAVEHGVGAVSVAPGTWNGVGLHAHRYLIRDVLEGELGFDGIVLGDADGLDELDGQEGFTETEVATAVNAGVDMVTVDDYRRFVRLLRAAVHSGRVGLERIDDAVRRVLTAKVRLGRFERPFTDRRLAATVGSPAHRELAREAVRRSLVLLRNAHRTLPLARGGRYYLAGGAGASIRSALPGMVYGRDALSVDSSYQAGIVVVGEAAAASDTATASLVPDPRDVAAAERVRAAGVPVVVVLVSGRPLDVAARLPGWDALLAAWLPGSEGRGVSDVLFGDQAPTGRLPMTWMAGPAQQPINDGDGKPALFRYGFGLTWPVTTPTAAAPSATSRSTSRPAVCSVAYRVVNEWDVGFQADVTVRNTGVTPIDGWRLVWTFPDGQRVTQLWGGVANPRGDTVTVVNESWNGVVAPGATATLGFTASHGRPNRTPVRFSLNGKACVAR
jgi:beta-glucosidase